MTVPIEQEQEQEEQFVEESEQAEQQVEEPEQTESQVEEPEESESVKYSRAVQKRIDKITRDKYEAQKKIKELEEQLKDRNVGRPVRPDIEHFKNEYGDIKQREYNSAMSDYEDKFFDWKQRNAKERELEERTRINAEAKKTKFMAQSEEMRQSHPDFDEVIERPVFSQQLSQAIFESEKGAEIAYYLGQHEEEALNLSQLSPISMVRELQKLENKFKKSISNASEPIKPLTGSKTGKQKSWAEMTDEEWYRMRERERLQKGG